MKRKSELTKQEFAETFGRSVKQIERYCQDGMPHRREGRNVFIPIAEGRSWFLKHIETQAVAKVQPNDRSAAIDRQEQAAAEKAEIELAQLRGELMPVADFERLLSDAFGRVRARLVNLPPRIAGIVLGATSIQEAQARIEPLVREAMEELRRADDVPEEDDADEGRAA